MDPITRAPQFIDQVVCDGVYLYAVTTDNVLWRSALEFPLAWTQLPALPNNELVNHIGVTLGAVKDLPDEVLFAVTQKPEILYFFNGADWRQEWPLQ